jgi:hypothetical protein
VGDVSEVYTASIIRLEIRNLVSVITYYRHKNSPIYAIRPRRQRLQVTPKIQNNRPNPCGITTYEQNKHRVKLEIVHFSL